MIIDSQRTATEFHKMASRVPDFKHFICDRLLDHKRYIHKYGKDMSAIRNWKWKGRR